MTPKPPKTESQKLADWVRRTAKKFATEGGNEGAIFTKPRGQNPLVKVANEYFRKKHLRKLN
ncbi:MAG: hypothetical protein ABR987_17940 [Terracidiphilus sp.]|jgi:hypothetical protein